MINENRSTEHTLNYNNNNYYREEEYNTSKYSDHYGDHDSRVAHEYYNSYGQQDYDHDARIAAEYNNGYPHDYYGEGTVEVIHNFGRKSLFKVYLAGVVGVLVLVVGAFIAVITAPKHKDTTTTVNASNQVVTIERVSTIVTRIIQQPSRVNHHGYNPRNQVPSMRHENQVPAPVNPSVGDASCPANVKASLNSDSLALIRAVASGDGDTVTKLLNCGANINVRDSNGYTALHWAANLGRPDLTRILLSRGANVNARENNGYTPLHWAALNGNVDVARALLDSGADVNARNNSGYTALQISFGKTNMQTLLRSRGAQ